MPGVDITNFAILKDSPTPELLDLIKAILMRHYWSESGMLSGWHGFREEAKRTRDIAQRMRSLGITKTQLDLLVNIHKHKRPVQ